MTSINLLTLKETIYQKPTELYGVVDKCSICGDKHTHAAQEGHVQAHCINRNTSYELVINRKVPENLRLAKKYNIDL